MLRAKSLARLNGRILRLFSQRTTIALRAALPLRLALPHLEPVLVLNVEKEVEKDSLVIQRASELTAQFPPDWTEILPQLVQATKEIDQEFLKRIDRFPIDIVIRYEEIVPIRTRRMKLLFEAAQRIQARHELLTSSRKALRATLSQDELTLLLYELFRLYAEETRSLSRSVRLPGPLAFLREVIAQELLNVMLRVARPLANEITMATFVSPENCVNRKQ